MTREGVPVAQAEKMARLEEGRAVHAVDHIDPARVGKA
jgi:hypothetical protein